MVKTVKTWEERQLTSLLPAGIVEQVHTRANEALKHLETLKQEIANLIARIEPLPRGDSADAEELRNPFP